MQSLMAMYQTHLIYNVYESKNNKKVNNILNNNCKYENKKNMHFMHKLKKMISTKN